ncbi:TonB-dependent receptor [Ideonella sp. DXS29W]|uniref:TonB-dependent receptor n=1 Tax=Ideonella lacteola TaxID=2984193 RepID=A0ABU9BYF0_9BURK
MSRYRSASFTDHAQASVAPDEGRLQSAAATPMWPAGWRHAGVTVLTGLVSMAAAAQDASPPAAPAGGAAPAPKPDAPSQRVEVTGARQTDTDERRQSTAAKIIVGRDEIERFGDSSLGDVLKRLPGVTVGGNPGRGGAIRMRGLGGGYTQILLDGERVQGGLSLDSIDPEMVERIEILRAPTAETGARAVAGTINIITREGFRKRLNDLKLGFGIENGNTSPGASWSRDDKWGDLNYNVTLNTWSWRRDDESLVTTHSLAPSFDEIERTETTDRRHGLNFNARLQFPMGEGASLMLMPFMVFSEGGGARQSDADFTPATPKDVDAYTRSVGDSDSRFMLARLNGQWRQPVGGGRLEVRGGLGASQSRNGSQRLQFGSDTTQVVEDTDSQEQTAHANAKYTLLLGESNNLVAGAEVDLGRRREDSQTRIVFNDQLRYSSDENLRASTQRWAAYAQDEWNLTPQWAAHAGLRWEGITTEGDGGDTLSERNQSSVWTPLLHAVWKPEPKSRDQVRMSLTRSYRSPTLQNLLGRYNVSSSAATGTNQPTSPDSAGNPNLRPEMATGVDLAYEHYLSGGGMFSANLFYRRIEDVMRTVTALEEVPGFDDPRWVARPQNIGKASTQGLELEAKFRLNELVDDAPPVDLRANVSLFRSSVDSVPGPNNRLDSQPGGTANLGADYRWPGLPLSLGGNFNYTPGYTTRLAESQWLIQSAKRVLDAYVLWTVNPGMRVRVTASNLLQQDAETVSMVSDETTDTLSPTFMNWRVQLELKL